MTSEWLNGLISRGRSLLWDTPEVPIVRDQEQAVAADMFDELAYEMIHHAAPNLRHSIEDIAQTHDYVAPAYADLFQMLNQASVDFTDVKTMREGYDANHGLLSALWDTPEFEALREHTVHDEWSSAFAMLAMHEDMARRFEAIEEARQAKADADTAAQQAQQGLQQAIDDAGQPGADEGDAGQAIMAAEQAAQAAQDALDAAQTAQDQAVDQAGSGAAASAQQAADDLTEQEATAASYGVNAGQLERMPFEERRALMDKLDSDKLRDLAKLVGAFRQYGDAERRRKVKHAPAVIVDVELGQDMSNLVPDELMRMAIPELEDLFWLNYAQRSLLQWEKRGPEHAGQGPIIVVCDESGSMNQDVGGYTREMWSKALSLALSDQAKRGHRDFIYIGFANHSQVWEKRYLNGHITLDDTIEFVTHFYHGGTDYERPLTRAKEIVREYANSEKGQPDIVFITDDDCDVSNTFADDWAKACKALDCTVYGIQIGPPIGGVMRRLCDRTIQLSRLNSNPEGMQELFRTI